MMSRMAASTVAECVMMMMVMLATPHARGGSAGVRHIHTPANVTFHRWTSSKRIAQVRQLVPAYMLCAMHPAFCFNRHAGWRQVIPLCQYQRCKWAGGAVDTRWILPPMVAPASISSPACFVQPIPRMDEEPARCQAAPKNLQFRTLAGERHHWASGKSARASWLTT